MLSAGLGGAGAYTRGESPRGVLLGLGTRITRITAGQWRYYYPHRYPHRTRIAPASPPWLLAWAPPLVHRSAAVVAAAARSVPLGGSCAGVGRGVGRGALSGCGLSGVRCVGCRGAVSGDLGCPGSQCLGVRGVLALCGSWGGAGCHSGGVSGWVREWRTRALRGRGTPPAEALPLAVRCNGACSPRHRARPRQSCGPEPGRADRGRGHLAELAEQS